MWANVRRCNDAGPAEGYRKFHGLDGAGCDAYDACYSFMGDVDVGDDM